MRVRICGNLPPIYRLSLFIVKALTFGARFALFIALTFGLSVGLLRFALSVSLIALRSILIQRLDSLGDFHGPQSATRFLVRTSLAMGYLFASGLGPYLGSAFKFDMSLLVYHGVKVQKL